MYLMVRFLSRSFVCEMHSHSYAHAFHRQGNIKKRSITRSIATADLVGNVYVTASLLSISSSNPGSLPTGGTTFFAHAGVSPIWALQIA
jgi:hypothetical protein